MGGPEVKFTQTGSRLVLHGLPEKAPSPLATVYEIQCEGEMNFGVAPFHIPLDDWQSWAKYWAEQEGR
jgi:hypothetical protein